MSTAGDRTRQTLVEAAGQVIATRGWGAASVRQVARVARVRSGVVNYHFRSIDELRREAARAAADQAFRAPIERMLAQVDPVAGVRELVAGLEALDPLEPCHVVLFEAALAATRDPLLQRQTAAILAEGRVHLAGWVARVCPAADATSTAAAILCLLDGLLLHRAVDQEVRAVMIQPALEQLLCPVRSSAARSLV